jgi:hypothetical protein
VSFRCARCAIRQERHLILDFAQSCDRLRADLEHCIVLGRVCCFPGIFVSLDGPPRREETRICLADFKGAFVKTMLSTSLLCVAALCAIPASTQENTSAPKVLHFTETSKIHVAAQAPTALATIFSNLGPPTNTYNDTFAVVVAGPASTSGVSFSYALPFTPKSNAHVRSSGRAAMARYRCESS